MKPFLIEQDANRQNSGAIQQSDVIYNIVLVAGIEQSFLVPSGPSATGGTIASANIVLFGSTGNFYCGFDRHAAVPVANVIDGSGCELNPTLRAIDRVSRIYLIAPSNCIVTMAFYLTPKNTRWMS